MLQPISDFANKLDQFDLSDLSFIRPLGPWLDQHPLINTIALVANHIFRTLPMYAFISLLLPYSLAVNCGIAIAGSLFYRLTVERLCVLRFAIPACLGSVAVEMAKPALSQLIHLSAHQSFKHLAISLAGVAPLTLYFTAIVWISYTSAQKRATEKLKNCCSS